MPTVSPHISDSEILMAVANGTLSPEKAKELLTAMRPRDSRLTLKVSGKGAVSVYGIGRWPVTLYSEQWLRVLDYGDEIRRFIAEHKGELSYKH